VSENEVNPYASASHVEPSEPVETPLSLLWRWMRQVTFTLGLVISILIGTVGVIVSAMMLEPCLAVGWIMGTLFFGFIFWVMLQAAEPPRKALPRE
jgi:hypothetical protein